MQRQPEAVLPPRDRPYDFLAPPQGPDELGRIDGYRILRVLGEGGMGIVFEAHDPKLERKVAIKVVRPGEADASLQKRFLQEARLAASLASEQIVTIFQVGQFEGATYLAMELLTGETLESRLAREHSLPLAESLRIAREAAEGLAVAHDKHLIHRDIKPANIWLRSKRASDPYCRVKLLDFGIARPVELSENLTTQGQIVGTPNYMSPEQACGLQLDERSDLFSLGCLLYVMLSGRLPFQRDSEVSSLRAVVAEEPQPIKQHLPSLPKPVVRLIERLLKKSPNDRPASARQVVEMIRAIEKSAAGPAAAVPIAATSAELNSVARRDKLGWGVWASGLVLLAAIAFGVWFQLRQFSGRTPPGQTPPGEALALAGGPAAAAAAPASATLSPVKIGILHSLSGPMATSERCVVDSFLLAVDELNASGGVMGGHPIEVIVRDGKSNELNFAKEAEDLIANEGVVTLFGCYRSPSRKLVEEVCRRHDHLLVYPTAYEGLEQSPYVMYMGGAPNQQVLPAVKWAFAFLGRRRFFLIGADGIYSQAVHEIVRDELASLGATVAGEEFRRLGDMNFSEIADKVKSSGADVVLNTVTGIGNAALFRSLRAAGVDAASVPTISFKITEEELRAFAIGPEDMSGDYAAASYFQSLPREQNQNFIQAFRGRFGDSRVVNDPMAAAYAGMYFWASAVDSAKSLKPADIRGAFTTLSFEAPEGSLAISSENQHALRSAVIGQIRDDLEFDIVWSSPRPIDPLPFPSSRTPQEWQQFEQRWFREWGDCWRPEADKHAD